MTDTEQVETTDTEENETESTEEVESQETEEEVSEDQDSGLKKALAAERKARRDAEKRAKAAEQAVTDRDKPAEEQALEAARREAREEALGVANERIVRSEVKAAATGKVKNPALALKLIDTSAIEVGDDGEVDAEAVNDAINELLEQYPELAADGRKFAGSADQGAKGRSAKPAQLTRADLQNMTPDQINKARTEGRLDTLMGVSEPKGVAHGYHQLHS